MKYIKKINNYYTGYYHSNIGNIKILNTKKGILQVSFSNYKELSNFNTLTEKILESLHLYFTSKIPLNTFPIVAKLTTFQQKVYEFLQQEITFGKTISYKDLALELNTSPRAIGRIMAFNPICLFVPCHRVIQNNGSLGGYAYGKKLKNYLLMYEKSCSL